MCAFVDQKIDIATLIASHPALSGASALLPSKADKNSSSSILNQGVLPAPLPTVVQERLDREAAYEKTKEEGAKWAGVMKRIKEAEHLSFPLQASDRGGVKSSGEMLAGFKPENKRESAVHALLQRANLTDASMAQKEDQALEAQELSIEEIAARRDNLRQLRELMFRAESRAKRVAKIKSKTFRKLARKRQERAGGDVDLDYRNPEEADEEREKLERARAVERATLRHGARNGRWARDFGGDGGEIEDRRRAKEDMLDIKERLQRKIMGREDGEAPSSEDDDDDVGDDAAAIKNRAFDQLAGLDANEPAEEAGQGLMQMAFMKKAREREMRKVAEDEQDLRRYIELFGDEDNGSDEEEEDGDEMETAQVMRVEGNEGRMVFSGPISVSLHGSAECASLMTSREHQLLLYQQRLPRLLHRYHHCPPDHGVPLFHPIITLGLSHLQQLVPPESAILLPLDPSTRHPEISRCRQTRTRTLRSMTSGSISPSMGLHCFAQTVMKRTVTTTSYYLSVGLRRSSSGI